MVEEDEEEEDMSSYERERLARIKHNNAFLLNLGIDSVQTPVTPKVCVSSENTPDSYADARESTRGTEVIRDSGT